MDMGDDFKRDLSMHALLSAACGQMLTQGYFDREGTFGISKGSAHGNPIETSLIKMKVYKIEGVYMLTGTNKQGKH
eukprot:scaffold305806_cov18-Tisochrysis_lutea.AAC.1